jgi:dolichol kinase
MHLIIALLLNVIIAITILTILLHLFQRSRSSLSESRASSNLSISTRHVHHWHMSEATIRKLFHITIGPTFVICWCVFPDNVSSRYWAALVPLLCAFYFLLVGHAIIDHPLLVIAATNSGSLRSLRRGPVYYAIAHAIIAATLWLETPTAVLSVIAFCIGDGAANLIGRFGACFTSFSFAQLYSD